MVGIVRTGGEGGIRTSGTGLNGARGDVRVSYRDSIFYPETEGRMALRLCAQPVRFPVQSKGEWLAILWLKSGFYDALKRPNWFARDCAPTVQSKSKKYLRTMCSSKGEWLAISEILARHPLQLIIGGRQLPNRSFAPCSGKRQLHASRTNS